MVSSVPALHALRTSQPPMYLPTHFAQPDVAELHRLMQEFPLASLVTNGPQGLDANPLPFEFDADVGPHGTLIAHVARANPLWKEIPNEAEVLVIFRGGDAYISPNWYPSKHEDHRSVPTWNYRLVHVHGRIRMRDDEKFVRKVVARLTRNHEGRTPDNTPWKMGDSAPEYIDARLAEIVGLEITVERMIGKWKVSQNRSARDRNNVVQELQKRGECTISEAMRAVKS